MKEWYCLFRGRKEGPFSIADLKRHPRFTPDTLVWKKGFSEWVKAEHVRELAKIFKEEKRRSKGKNQSKEKDAFNGAEILTARQTPPPYLFLVIILIIVSFFVYFLFYL